MDHTEYLASQWRVLADTLEALRTARVGITEACRKVVAIRAAVGEEANELFHPFVAVDSETDAFPLGEVRATWSETALARVDDERRAAEEYYRPHLIGASAALIEYAKKHAL
jgi:hypothetical protein